MSSVDADLLQADRQGDEPAHIADAAADIAAVEDGLAGDTPVAERDVEADELVIPDSSADGGTVKYVPASALAGARGELKELKAQLKQATEGSAKAQQLADQIQQMQGHLQQLSAKAQAYDAAVAAQQSQRQPEPVEDDSEAIELAQDLDLYTPEGKPNVEKARKILARMDKRAESHARKAVSPLAQHTVSQQSQIMLARAKATTAPNGQKPDPAILDAIWQRLDPALTATPDGAKQAFAAAMGYTALTAQAQPAGAKPQAQRGADGKFAKADIPDPLYTEKAGGKDSPHVALSDGEKKYLKEVGMSEADYIKAAESAPWLKRGQ